jgi:16S rRNA (guanine527-N7)-methyltransferase
LLPEKDEYPLSEQSLATELQELQIELPSDQVERLAAYHAQLLAWNDRLNLTRHTDLRTFAQRDVLDSWHLAQWLERGERVLDVGTGGGVPGILLAIMRPDLRVSLCDSVGKKAAAVAEMVRELKLAVPVHSSRVEPLLEHQRFDVLVFRAVGPLEKILRAVEPHWSSFKRLLMIKGPAWTEERLAARHKGLLNQLELRRLASYRPPGHYGDSVILTVFPKANP